MESAEAALREVIDKAGRTYFLQEVARQRLDRVLADQERGEEGPLSCSHRWKSTRPVGRREEVRGDLLLGLGRVDEARQGLYLAAIEAICCPRVAHINS